MERGEGIWNKGGEQLPRVGGIDSELGTVVGSPWCKETKRGSGSEVSIATWPLTLSHYFPFSSAPFGNLFYCLHDLRLFRILHTNPPVCCSFYFSPLVSPGCLSATSGLQVASSSAGFFLFLTLSLWDFALKTPKATQPLLPGPPGTLDIPPFFSTRPCTHQSLLSPRAGPRDWEYPFSLGILFPPLKAFLLDACPTLCLCCPLAVMSCHLFSLSKMFYLLIFGHAACGILVPHPGIGPVPPEVETQSFDNWITREFLRSSFLILTNNNSNNKPQ